MQFSAEVLAKALTLTADLSLRGADAVHFASAIVLQQNLPTLEGFRLVCCDNELLEAAQQMGITIDGFDDGGVVAQQNVAEPVGMVGGQLELGGDVEVSEVGLIHIRFLRFRFRKTGNALAVPSEGKTRR